MRLSKQLTRREKILLIPLALLVIFAAYFFLVHRPVTEELDRISTRTEDVNLNLTVLTAKKQRMDQMQAELDKLLAQPNTAEIPAYDNLEQVMAYLNYVLAFTDKYSLSFAGVQQSDGASIVRRPLALSFECQNYELARLVVDQLQNCPYRCQISNLSLSTVTLQGADREQELSLTETAVSVSLTVTFFESAR